MTSDSGLTAASRRRYLKAVGAAGVGVAGLTNTVGAIDQGNETITLGAAISKTGDLATEGNLYLDSYKMTVQDINDRGGVDVGGTTYDLELKTYDDESNPTKSRQLFQRLIQQDNVKFLLGPYSSGVTLAAKPVVERAQLPMVEGGGASSKIFTSDNQWVFGVLATAPNYTKGCMELAKSFEDPPVETVGVAAQNDIFSKDSARGAKQIAKQNGWDVVVDQTFPKGTNDLSSILNRVKSENPDVFVLAAHFKHSVLLAKQMRQYKVSPPMTVSTVGATTADFIKETGATGNYIYGTSQWASNANYDGFFYGSAPDYVKRFTESHDYEPDYHNAAGSAAVLVYLNAFKQMDSLDPKKARDVIAATDLTTFFGNINFKKNGANDKTTVGYQWQDQQKKLVAPPKVAAADAVYPAPSWSER